MRRSDGRVEVQLSVTKFEKAVNGIMVNIHVFANISIQGPDARCMGSSAVGEVKVNTPKMRGKIVRVGRRAGGVGRGIQM